MDCPQGSYQLIYLSLAPITHPAVTLPQTSASSAVYTLCGLVQLRWQCCLAETISEQGLLLRAPR